MVIMHMCNESSIIVGEAFSDHVSEEEKGPICGLSIFDSLIYSVIRPFDAKNPFMAAIKVNRELHKGGDRSCMHIELDITGSRIR